MMLIGGILVIVLVVGLIAILTGKSDQ